MMKFSTIILAASILLLDTGVVQGKAGKPAQPGKSGKKQLIENQCAAIIVSTEDGKVIKKVCMKTVGCAVDDDNVCIDFELIACAEITNPNQKECKKNGCVFDKKAGTCEVNRKGKIDNECTADALDTLLEVDKKVCMKTVGCIVEDKVCVDVTPCDEITNQKDCKKNGCVFNKGTGTCEVHPLDLCLATCTTGEDTNCCLKECHCSNYDKGGKCKKDNNCVANKDTKVCALKTAGDTPKKDKCSQLTEEKCTSNKGVKKGCAYNMGSCVQTVVGCAVHNGQATDCNIAGCAYNECTEQCSKKKKLSSQKDMVYGIV